MLSPTTPPEPGIYENVPFDEYLLWPYINNSSLTAAKKSMRHYRAKPEREETPALRFGTLVHTGKLEPLAIIERYIVMPAFEEHVRRPDGREYEHPKASKAYKDLVAEFVENNPDKIIVEAAHFERLKRIIRELTKSERARYYLDGPGPVEVSLVWDDDESGLRCKARVDKWSPERGLIADLKTSCDPGQFEKFIANCAYHRQGAMYLDGFRALTGRDHQFCLVAAESDEPFCVRAAPLAQSAIEHGRDEYKRLLCDIADCRLTDRWPGYPDPDFWMLPAWAMPAEEPLELSVGGEAYAL